MWPGEKLESLMNSYTRLTHQFELENGYAYKSEIVGVLVVLALRREDYASRLRTFQVVRNPCGSWQASDFQAGHPASG
ncbi:MAG: hypothetical protein ACLU6Y_16635 [Ruminococcus sp.]